MQVKYSKVHIARVVVATLILLVAGGVVFLPWIIGFNIVSKVAALVAFPIAAYCFAVVVIQSEHIKSFHFEGTILHMAWVENDHADGEDSEESHIEVLVVRNSGGSWNVRRYANDRCERGDQVRVSFFGSSKPPMWPDKPIWAPYEKITEDEAAHT